MGESSTQSSSYVYRGISAIDTLITGSMPSEICDVKARFDKLQINCDMSCACCNVSCKAKRSAEVCVRTAVPSQSPSTSVIPSNQPSVVPTGMPSFIPSHRPSRLPSAEPSRMPSDKPSTLPSLMPSDDPSTIPTVEQSFIPISLPSYGPSQLPSTSIIPSNQPSVVPTGVPSFIPSHRPSSTPGNGAALLQFYNDLDGPNWNFSNNWLTENDFCTWTGVTCFGENVISLKLVGKGLKGQLSSSIFTDLPMLESLILEGNSLSGKSAQSNYYCRICWCVI